MVDITEISAAVAAAGMVVGVAYYILDLRHNMRAREMETCRLVVSDYTSEQATKRWATPSNCLALLGPPRFFLSILRGFSKEQMKATAG